MEKDVEVYKGLDNRDLKMLTAHDWEFPPTTKNPLIKDILTRTKELEAGEVWQAYKGNKEQAQLLLSALWRIQKKHSMGFTVKRRGDEVYIRKDETA